ncbi:stage II sporulation protein D [Priestia koreensis]|uniref:stage II sporulation protein D n=1 Tax=Priestia koreensis TaxID=284581 RepID=UPI0030183CE9
MKRLKPVVVIIAILSFVILCIPTVLVIPFTDQTGGKLGEDSQQHTQKTLQALAAEPAVEVAVYRAKKQEVEEVPLEDYVVGVVASEMKADFEMEALKAQSLAARTYIVRKLVNGSELKMKKGSKEFDARDTTADQVYASPEELKIRWGSDYDQNMKKITEAVEATRGKVIVYNNAPIDAVFYSTSNGRTEDAKVVWGSSLPYLQSIDNPWDKDSPKFTAQTSMTVSDFEQKIYAATNKKVSINDDLGKVLSRTPGGRVNELKIDGKTFKGTDIRSALGLKSTDFTWVRKGNELLITTKGNGHGIGMSQYGADGMAKAGKSYTDIIHFYYKNVQIAEASKYLSTLTAKK